MPGMKESAEKVNEDVINSLPGNKKVEDVVKEFLNAQSLSVLARNGLGDAIFDYVEKNDRGAISK